MKTYIELLQEAGLYTYRKLNATSIEYLHDWSQVNKIPNALRPVDYHCTVVQSDVPIPGYAADPTMVMLDPKTFGVQMLNQALVITFRSDALEEQWQRAMNLGAQSKWPTYVPHITLSYQIPVEFDLTVFKPPTSYLILEREECRAASTEWKGFDSPEEYTDQDIYVPHQSLDVPREKMPQIASINMMEFVDWMEEQGYFVRLIDIPAANLKSAQSGTDIGKVAMLSNGNKAALNKPLLISKDNYIIDGHHRWLAILNRDPQTIVEAYRVNLTFESLLTMTQTFRKAFYKPSSSQRVTESYK
jgi:hypothetical protein